MEVKDIDQAISQSIGNIRLENIDLTPEEVIVVKKFTMEKKSYLISLYHAYQEKNEVSERGKTYHK